VEGIIDPWSHFSEIPQKINEIISQYIHENADSFCPEIFEEHRQKRNRISQAAVPFDLTEWGKLLNHPDIKVENSSIAKKFRQRFRVPPKIFFDVLVPLCEGIFSTGGRRCIPIELKIMVSLRILGRDAVADDCNELCGIGGSTCNAIFKQFVKGFSKRDYHQFIRIPTCNSDELLRTMEVYRKLGFPCCFGSMDVTHVRWNRCPRLLKHEHLGKEGYPSLAFQVIVNHSRLIYHISPAYMGSYNDKTISRNDRLILI
jgi:hypothetical protein